MSQLTPKVLGIGGIFFKSADPSTTRQWYANNLGMDVKDFGSIFESRDLDNPEQLNQLVWSPFKHDTTYFAPSEKDFMINYRVQNIEGLVQQLRDAGATILDDIQSSEYGKFVHILDPDGNKLEFWEAV